MSKPDSQVTSQPQPSNRGEPQSVRDAYDAVSGTSSQDSDAATWSPDTE